jgi:hypothetical protein
MNVEAKSKVCPVCGYEFTAHRTGLRWITIALIILLLVYLILGLL